MMAAVYFTGNSRQLCNIVGFCSDNNKIVTYFYRCCCSLRAQDSLCELGPFVRCEYVYTVCTQNLCTLLFVVCLVAACCKFTLKVDLERNFVLFSLSWPSPAFLADHIYIHLLNLSFHTPAKAASSWLVVLLCKPEEQQAEVGKL